MNTWPTDRSIGAAAPVQSDCPTASTVTSTLSAFAPALATTYVPDPRRSARTRPDASIEISEGSRTWNVGAGLEYRVSRTTLFVEGRYVNAGAVSGFPGTTVFPIIAGVRFGAP